MSGNTARRLGAAALYWADPTSRCFASEFLARRLVRISMMAKRNVKVLLLAAGSTIFLLLTWIAVNTTTVRHFNAARLVRKFPLALAL